MIIKRTENFQLKIYQVSGEPFHWKPIYDCIKHSFWKVENGIDFKWVNTWAHYIPVTNRCFWLWWCIDFTVFPKNIGGKTPCRYVNLNKTHLEPMKYPHGSWRDELPPTKENTQLRN